MRTVARLFWGLLLAAGGLAAIYGAMEIRAGRLSVPVGAVPFADRVPVLRDMAASAATPPGEAAAPAARAEETVVPAADAAGPAGGLAENADLRINQAGLDVIKESEGLRLEAYRLGDQWLIGYGHAATARPGLQITQAEAEALLREDVRATEDGLKRRLRVPVNDNQFSALVSLAYNLGLGGFERTVVYERLNAGDYAGAADGFLKHDRARIDGVLKPLPHLTARREKERALFLTPPA